VGFDLFAGVDARFGAAGFLPAPIAARTVPGWVGQGSAEPIAERRRLGALDAAIRVRMIERRGWGVRRWVRFAVVVEWGVAPFPGCCGGGGVGLVDAHVSVSVSVSGVAGSAARLT
jgi:hypothetical protein